MPLRFRHLDLTGTVVVYLDTRGHVAVPLGAKGVVTVALGAADLATLRLRLLKLGARVIETVSRIRLAFAAACREAELVRRIAITLQPAGP